MKNKTLIVKIDWGLGRVIAMSGAITELAKTRPIKVITSRPLVFWGNPYVEVHGLDDRRLFEDVIKGNDYFELEPYTDPQFFNDWVNRLEIASKQLWLKKVAQPILYLAEHEKINNVLEGNKPILYQPFGSTMQGNGADKSYRSIRTQDAQYIANALSAKGYTLYEVIKPGQPVLQWCNILDTPDLRFVISLCDRYPVLWCDSCLHHASKAFGKQAVVLWAWTDAGRYGYDSNINMREHDCIHTPLRLMLNDFDFDISNQHSNMFSKEFLDKVISLYE